jgi:hypothetical protein
MPVVLEVAGEAETSKSSTLIGGCAFPLPKSPRCTIETQACEAVSYSWNSQRKRPLARGRRRARLGFGEDPRFPMDALCKAMRVAGRSAAITNDIYTRETPSSDAIAALADERIMGVETGGCPHTAIREDARSISPRRRECAALPGARLISDRMRRRQSRRAPSARAADSRST